MKINESSLRKIVRQELKRTILKESLTVSDKMSLGSARGVVEGLVEKFLSGEKLQGALARAKQNLPQITKPIPTSELYLGIKEHLQNDSQSNDVAHTNDILAGMITGKKSVMYNGMTDKILGASTGILKFSPEDAAKFVDAVKVLIGFDKESQQAQKEPEENYPDDVTHIHGLPGTTRSSIATISGDGKQRIDDPKPTPGRNYTIKKGDTLSSIAKTAYGDANSYQIIADENDDLIVDKNKIEPGWHIYIPPAA